MMNVASASENFTSQSPGSRHLASQGVISLAVLNNPLTRTIRVESAKASVNSWLSAFI